ncbi:MAG: DNA polymerase III subunit gamma/tau [Parcubacteria group bacterium Gr01-1014_13]|nr:MAG: DNA polymerase III subunit gamma/tau [Parcubacteria group bacterium Gr01-1014_13]
MSTIYRKYRPQQFSDVTGQEHIIKTITNEVNTNKIAHAYLFSGPRGTGKTTLARLLAKAINCPDRKKNDYEPCGTCQSCTEITAGHSIDIIEIDAASHTGVDNVRENIIDNAQFKPTKSKYKVFIIDEVHMLSTSAFNALLKTLEEPPSHVIFVLATTEQHKLPATIISRCQRFNFKRVGYEDMMKRLAEICKSEKVKVDKKVLERIINKSDGCMRDAESLLGQVLSLDLKDIGPEDAEMILPTSNIQTVLEFIDAVFDRQVSVAIKILQDQVADGVNLEQFAYDCLEAMRLLMILQIDPQTKNITVDYNNEAVKELKKISAKATPLHLVKMIESLVSRRRDIKSAPMPQLPLELFVIEFTCSSDQGSEQPLVITNKESVMPQKASLNTIQDDNQEKPLHAITQTIKDTISTLTHRPVKTTTEEIKSKWNDVIQAVAKENHSLGFILKMCDIKDVNDEGLHLSVPYSFHKDKLDENKTKKTIEKTLTEFFSEHIQLHCAVSENSIQKNDEELNKVAADFGGEII